ncbi:pentatricopeptide repeat-containing protein, partial [Quercus suber]
YLFETHSPDIVSFNALISGFASFHQPRPFFEIFNTLRHLGLEPDNYARAGDVEKAEKCFGECLVLDNVVWSTAMVCGYVWNGEFEKARWFLWKRNV